MRFRFVHAADLHLDTPFEGIGRVDPRLAGALRDASVQALGALVELALAREAAFVVIAGDVYDGAERGVRAQIAFRRAVEQLARAGIQTLIVHGNHDPLHDGWSAVRRWPAAVHVFGADAVEQRTIDRDGRRLAVVHGISYAHRDTLENLARRFARSADDVLQVGLLHANVGTDADEAPYSACTLEDLAATGLDYWALGHVHRHAVLREGRPWAVYPGVLQGRSPHVGERGAKGACVVEVDGSTVVGVEHVALDRIRFAVEDLDVGDLADLPELEDALVDRGAELLAAAEGRSLLLRLRLVGRGPVHADLVRDGALLSLLEHLRAGASVNAPWLWWERLVDATAAAHDHAAIAARGDFASELLRLAAELEADPLARQQAMGDWLQARHGDPDPDALGDAVDLALDLVAGESS